MEDFAYMNSSIQQPSPFKYYITRAGSNRTLPDFNIDRTSAYPYCVIHYIKSGSGYLIYKNKRYSISAGQLFVLGPGEAHQYASEPGTYFELNWIEFSGGDCANFINYIIENCSPVISAPSILRINRYILKILTILQNKPETKSTVLVSKLIYTLLLLMYESCNEQVQANISPVKLEGMSKVEKYIESNLGESLSIDQLATIANFSPTYFAKLFHKVNGSTPSKFILHKRLIKAKELLCNTETKLDYIAESLGFCNTSHFIREFKKAEDITPAQFRQQCIQFKQYHG